MRPVTVLISAALAALLAITAAAFADQLIGAPRWITLQTLVGTSATLVAPSRPNRWQVKVAMGAGAPTGQVHCGPTNGVTAGNGYPIPNVAATAISIDTQGEVWCIATVAQIVATMENY